ncbi:patatin-like phospholipase family protein [Bosea sp. RAF48]|uniref:patatin-like phospholipase family protein n=1 Tax=Bosea sp. RAF48 TaxID=3237480 RepID=UPI003F92AFC7
MPASLAASARIEHVDLARFWGDLVTPEIRAVIERQYDQTYRAVRTGQRAASALRQANFLAISGGGADGAFAAGYLTGWTERGDRPQFEVVTGVSTGALAAPFAFLGSRYDGPLQEVFTLYGDAEIYTSLGVFGVLGRGLYDNTPLRNLIDRYLTDEMIEDIAVQYRLGRRLLIQTTNIDAQRPVVWDLSAIAAGSRPERRERMVEILLASAAIPAVFPPVRIDVQVDGERRQELHVDGGTVAQIFFAPPDIGLNQFERRRFGAIRSRKLYLIRNGRLLPQYETTEETAIGVAKRAIETLVKYQTVSDLVRLQLQTAAGGAKLFYAAIPNSFTATPKSDFDRSYMQQLFATGREEGARGAWRTKPPLTPIQTEPTH